jgi:hypothetical protein
MSSALRVILGLSMLAAVGCDDGGGEDGNTGGSGLTPLAGTAGTAPNTAGMSGNTGGGGSGTGGTGMVEAGVPLTPMDGWVDMGTNTLGIQGAMFAYADDTSKMGMVEDFAGDHACISGTAAEVDMMSTPCATMMFTAPATDCYGQYWGAAIGLNLNQPIDPVTMKGTDPPLTFDAAAKGIKGFAFEITGEGVPSSLRFKIEDSSGEYCNTGTMPVMKGANSFVFADLQAMCWKPAATNPTAEMAKSGIVKIAWQVVTKMGATVPFNYCVSNVRALL